MSPAKIVFGQPQRDAFTFVKRLTKFANRLIRCTWREAWRAKEDVLRMRAVRNNAALLTNSRPLLALHRGDRMFLQNQTGNHPRKWDKVGTVTEALKFDQYAIKEGGWERITKRNRRFHRLTRQVEHNTSLLRSEIKVARYVKNLQVYQIGKAFLICFNIRGGEIC